MNLILVNFINFIIAVKFYNNLSLSKIKDNIFSEEVENVPITFTPFVASKNLVRSIEKSKIPIRIKSKNKGNDAGCCSKFESKIPVRCKKNNKLIQKTNEDATYKFTKLNFLKNIEPEENSPEILDKIALISSDSESLKYDDQNYIDKLFEMQNSYTKLIKEVMNKLKIVNCKYKLSFENYTKNLSVNINLVEEMASRSIQISKKCIFLYKHLQQDMKLFNYFYMLDELEVEFNQFLTAKKMYTTFLKSSLVFLDNLNIFETNLKFFYEKTENFLNFLEEKFESLNLMVKEFEQRMSNIFFDYKHVNSIVKIFEYINALYIIDKNSNSTDFSNIKNLDDFFSLPDTEKIFKYNLHDFISQNKECIKYWDNLRDIIIRTKNNSEFSMLNDLDSIDELFEKIIVILKDTKNGVLSNVCQRVNISNFSQKLQEFPDDSSENIEKILVEMIVEYFIQ